MFAEKDLIFPVSDTRLDSLAQGRFARRILLLSSENSDQYAAEQFLIKVLAAAQINMEQDTLFAVLAPDLALGISALLKSKQPETVLVFGLPPKQLQLAIQPTLYRSFEFYGATWLWADPLSKIESDKNLKTQLWRALQQLFALRS